MAGTRSSERRSRVGGMKFWHWDAALPMAAAALLAVLAYRLGLGLHVENERLRASCRERRSGPRKGRIGRLFGGKSGYLLFAAGPSMALFTAFLVGVGFGLESPPSSRTGPAAEIVVMVDPLPEPPAPRPEQLWTAPGCRPLPLSATRGLVERIAPEEGVPPELVLAVIFRESRFSPCAVSPSGAVGLMQLKPATARLMGVGDLLDPEQNIRGGARYLRLLLERFDGNVALALGAYHAGPGRVNHQAHLTRLPATRRYVGDVLSLAETFAGD